jgi:NitT/TauT family transport system permease protein
MVTKDAELSISELRELESEPKTFAQKLVGRVVSFLPFISAMLVILNYKLTPNFKEFTGADVNKPTNVWTVFIGVFALIFFIRAVTGLFNKRVYEKIRYNAPIYTAVFLLLLAYDWITLKKHLLPLPYFPWGDAILNAIISDRKILLQCVYHSLLLLFSGYFAGSIAGIVTGVAAGWSRTARYWIMPVLKVLGPIPSTTWLPIILIVASSLFGGSVFLIALGVWFPVAMTTMTGVLSIPKSNFEAARTFGASKRQMIFKVAIPAASPFIFQGLTQGMSLACTTLLVAEMMGVKAGLGWYINWQRGWGEFAKMYAAVIIICLTFFCVNELFNFAKRRLLRWKEGDDIL